MLTFTHHLLSLPFPLSYPHNHDPTVPIKEGLRNVQDVIEKRQMGESTRRETAKTVQELLQKLQALKKLIDSKNVDQLASVRSAHPTRPSARVPFLLYGERSPTPHLPPSLADIPALFRLRTIWLGSKSKPKLCLQVASGDETLCKLFRVIRRILHGLWRHNE
jgi:hypothetical protein